MSVGRPARGPPPRAVRVTLAARGGTRCRAPAPGENRACLGRPRRAVASPRPWPCVRVPPGSPDACHGAALLVSEKHRRRGGRKWPEVALRLEGVWTLAARPALCPLMPPTVSSRSDGGRHVLQLLHAAGRHLLPGAAPAGRRRGHLLQHPAGWGGRVQHQRSGSHRPAAPRDHAAATPHHGRDE